MLEVIHLPVHLEQQIFHFGKVTISLGKLDLQRSELLIMLILHQNCCSVVLAHELLFQLDLIFAQPVDLLHEIINFCLFLLYH